MPLGRPHGPRTEPDTIEEKINNSLRVVKKNLGEQLSDHRMMQEVLKGILVYLNDTTATTAPPTLKVFMCYSMLGLQLAQKTPKAYPLAVQTGLFNLTHPELLKHRSLEGNFLEVKSIYKQLRDFTAQQDSENADSGGGGSLAEGFGGGAKPVEQSKTADDEAEEETDTYAGHKKMMQGVLENLADVVDGLLQNNALVAKFGKSSGLDDAESEKFLKEMKTKLGIVLSVVKVFEPKKVKDGMKLAAFVGPESYGKSSLINYIVSEGQSGDDFMPASEGMGTQVVCKISANSPESIQLASEPRPSAEPVQERMKALIEAQQKKREQGQQLGSKDMDMLRAQKPFDTQGYSVEFLDVPGIKEATVYHTELALSLSTSLVLVSGKPQLLKSQLESGDLTLLVDIVNRIDPPLPIQCVASFHVKEEDFGQAVEKEYESILRKFFPKSETISVRWMNFYASTADTAKRTEMVEAFYRDADQGVNKVMDPYKQFLRIEGSVDELTQKLHKFFTDELKAQYLDPMEPPEPVFEESVKAIQDSAADHQWLTTSLKDRLGEASGAFGEVDVKGDLKAFSVSVGGKKMSEVKNVVLVAQDLWNECRLCEIHFLQGAAKDLHADCFLNQVFAPLQEKVVAGKTELDDPFATRVADMFSNFGYLQRALSPREKGYWTQNFSSAIAPYLAKGNFSWFLTGFYLISSDSKNKHDFMNPFRLDKSEAPAEQWRQWLMEKVKAIPFPDWVSQCKMQGGDLDKLFSTICKCANAACGQFKDIATELGCLSNPGCHAMTELVEISYILTERLFVKMRNTDGQEYTAFGDYVKKFIGSIQELKALRGKMKTVEDEDLGNVFSEILGKMSTRIPTPEWAGRIEEGGELPGIVATIKMLVDMRKKPFTDSASDAKAQLLVPQQTKTMLTAKAFPSAAKYLKAGEGSCSCEEAPAKDKEFPAWAVATMSKTGRRVAVYLRRGDTSTYDPTNDEKKMLEQLRRQPRVTKLFVIWQPLSEGKPWADKFTQKWNKHDGLDEAFLDVELVQLAPSADPASFYSDKATSSGGKKSPRFLGFCSAPGEAENKTKSEPDEQVVDVAFDDASEFFSGKVAAAVQAAQAQAERNVDRIGQLVEELKNKFFSAVDDYCAAIEKCQQSTPQTLHSLMELEGEARKNLEKFKKDTKRSVKKSVEIPTADDLNAWFRQAALEKLTKEGGEEGTIRSLDEVSMRSFLYTVMLGQCLKHARDLARIVYRKVFLKTLDFIVNTQFFASANDVLEALKKFNEEYEPQVKKIRAGDMQAIYLVRLQEMFTEEAFGNIYAGYVTYQLMPVLYATILAKLHEQANHAVTAEYYRQNYLRSMTMLGDKSDLKFKLGHEAEKQMYAATEKVNAAAGKNML